MDRIQEIMQKKLGTSLNKFSFEKMTPEEYEQFRVDSFNTGVGNLDQQDGYNCPECMNKGIVARLVKDDRGTRTAYYDCKCRNIRDFIARAKRSGLADVIKDCTFAKWEAKEDWQKVVKGAAVEYSKDPKGWFYIGGQSGCGKTHLCTAICRKLMADKDVRYMQWREEIGRLKGMTTDQEQRFRLLDEWKTAEVLYIDDLFKTGRSQDGSEQRPTSADVNIAFEILNYRYNNPAALTIISSELTPNDLLSIDEAIGSRICERSKPLVIGKDQSRNYRTRNQIVL